MAQSHCKAVWQFPPKLNIISPYSTAITLLGIYLNKLKTHIHREIHTITLKPGLLIITPNWRQLRWRQPSMGEWMKKKSILHLYNGVLVCH